MQPLDNLEAVFRALRLTGTVYFEADFRAPWGMDMKPGRVASFHIVTGGQCWLRGAALPEPRRLTSGHVAVFPHGAGHTLSDRPRGHTQPAETLLAQGQRDGEVRPVYGGQGPSATLICGHFEYDRAALHPLVTSLPDCILLDPADAPAPAWMEAAARLAVSDGGAGPAAAVVDRLAEALLIQVLRAWMTTQQPSEGYLAAIVDPGLSRALRALHDAPDRDWSVEDLAGLASLSRSAFAARFKSLVGASPIHYLASWRMQRARALLLTEAESIAQVAASVGYQSEFAFAKAFKRHFGEAPGAMRRAHRASG